VCVCVCVCVVSDFCITRNSIVILEVPLLVNFKKVMEAALNIATFISSLLFTTPGVEPSQPAPGASRPLRLIVLPRRAPEETVSASQQFTHTTRAARQGG
jgi:carotenoid cleavage dioxygenase-like enzyme